MIHFNNLSNSLPLLKALGSEIRIKIMNLLIINKELALNEISAALGITSGALTSHIKILNNAGLISLKNRAGKRGTLKICSIAEDKIIIDITNIINDDNFYESNIPLGQYVNYQVSPTCGLSTPEHLIGEVDDPRYFAHPERSDIGILWFGYGYIEYIIPTLIRKGQSITGIQLSVEISSEAPGYNNDWPSDIYFSINGKEIGYWTSPGDFGDKRGIYTPSWWISCWNQYGLYKIISVNKNGSYVDGTKISNVKIDDLNLSYDKEIVFRFSIPNKAKQVGGLTLFGRNFGNYNQDINVKIHYK